MGILSPRAALPAPPEGGWAVGSFRRVDLRDRLTLRAVLEEIAPTRIFNLAAVGTYPGRSQDVTEYVDVNVRLPGSLFELMPAGCVLVQVGSMAQYRGAPDPLREDDAARDFATPYSWSKNAADSLLETLDRTALGADRSAVRARLFGVVGDGELPHRLLPTLARGCRDVDDVRLSDGDQVRDILHVEDAVTALAHVSGQHSLFGKAVNVARGEGRSIRWVAEHAAARLACRADLRFGAIARRAYEVYPRLVADVSRLTSTGWRPRWDYEESIDRAIDQLTRVSSAQPTPSVA